MIRYLIRRVLWMFPTLLAIALFSFWISIEAPGDPVERMIQFSDDGGRAANQQRTAELKAQWRHRLGLDRPLFYFSVQSAALPDTLYRIPNDQHRKHLKMLTLHNGNWPLVQSYYTALKSNSDGLSQLGGITEFDQWVHRAEGYSNDPELALAISNLRDSKASLIRYLPKLSFYGSNNQFHLWLSKAVRGNFGYSYYDGESVASKLWPKLRLSFLLTVASLFLSLLISIPIGVYAASRPDGFFDTTSAVVLFMAYSLPTFFVGTLLLYTFSNPDVLYWFPSAGLQNPSIFQQDWSIWTKIQHWMPHLVLPFITYTYGSLAYLSRITRSSIAEERTRDYITTARAKGLSENKILWKHALRNALLPLITVLGQLFPIAVGGSVIIETIFSLPGIGWEAYRAILNYDYPVIVAIFTLGGFMTVIGYITSDLLYAWADPRIRYDQ